MKKELGEQLKATQFKPSQNDIAFINRLKKESVVAFDNVNEIESESIDRLMSIELLESDGALVCLNSVFFEVSPNIHFEKLKSYYVGSCDIENAKVMFDAACLVYGDPVRIIEARKKYVDERKKENPVTPYKYVTNLARWLEEEQYLLIDAEEIPIEELLNKDFTKQASDE